MAVARLGGMVEGAPTARHNFLQRIDELRRIEAAAPPSAVDREEIERLRFLLTQAIDLARGGSTTEGRKRWADAVERDLALPEAKP